MIPLSAFTPEDYSPAVSALLLPERLPALGPGRENRSVLDRLAGLNDQALFGGAPIRDATMARACAAGLWLYHDFLDESHRISQTIETITGSYWHGIMHRREPDFSNAKYWFRRVGPHPIFNELARRAAEHAAGLSGGPAATGPNPTWDPFGFVDACEAALSRNDAGAEECRRISLIEWQLLFDYSYRHAIGSEA